MSLTLANINVGQFSNDTTGDTIRTAFSKINQNNAEIENFGGGGAQGPQGNQGNQGFQGTSGTQGNQGSSGTGSQGNQGNQGTQGPQGTQGNQGTPTSVNVAPGRSGNFTVSHGLGTIPSAVTIEMTTSGQIWFQTPVRYNSANIYLVSSDPAVTGVAQVWS